MPVGSGRKRRLRREKAAARRAAEEASAQQAAVAAATTTRQDAAGTQDGKFKRVSIAACQRARAAASNLSLFVQVKRARTSGGPNEAIGKEQSAVGESATQRDATEDWITGGDAKQRQREQRAERKRKAREGRGRDTAHSSSDAAVVGGERGGVDTNTVFVGGIPFSTTQDEIRQFFATHGCAGVVDVRIPMKDKDGYAKVMGLLS